MSSCVCSNHLLAFYKIEKKCMPSKSEIVGRLSNKNYLQVSSERRLLSTSVSNFFFQNSSLWFKISTQEFSVVRMFSAVARNVKLSPYQKENQPFLNCNYNKTGYCVFLFTLKSALVRPLNVVKFTSSFSAHKSKNLKQKRRV